MRIFHASDLHAFVGWRGEGLLGKRPLGWLNWMLSRRGRVDAARVDRFVETALAERPQAVAVTGDLGQLGLAGELERSAGALRRLSGAGLRVLCVPGNHDRYTPDRVAEAAVEALRREFSADETPPGEGAGAVFFSLLDQACPRPPWSSSGEMRSESWQLLEALAETRANREDAGRAPLVVLGHYPLRLADGALLRGRRGLKEAGRVEELLARAGATLYLCGHVHHRFEAELAGGVRQLCAGSLTQENHFYEIELAGGEVRWKSRSV